MTARIVDPYVVEEVWYTGNAAEREVARWVWSIHEPCRLDSDELGATLLLPARYLTDGASVPRQVPTAFALFGDTARAPAGFHDILYQSHMVPREVADRVFREAILARGGYTEVHALAMYEAVRRFGASSYESGPRRFAMYGNGARLRGPIILPLGAEIPKWAYGD